MLAWDIRKPIADRSQATVGVPYGPTFPLHGLRYIWATIALSVGIHPNVVSDRVGHSTGSLTLDVYSDVMPGLQEAAVAKVAGLIPASSSAGREQPAPDRPSGSGPNHVYAGIFD